MLLILKLIEKQEICPRKLLLNKYHNKKTCVKHAWITIQNKTHLQDQLNYQKHQRHRSQWNEIAWWEEHSIIINYRKLIHQSIKGIFVHIILEFMIIELPNKPWNIIGHLNISAQLLNKTVNPWVVITVFFIN